MMGQRSTQSVAQRAKSRTPPISAPSTRKERSPSTGPRAVAKLCRYVRTWRYGASLSAVVERATPYGSRRWPSKRAAAHGIGRPVFWTPTRSGWRQLPAQGTTRGGWIPVCARGLARRGDCSFVTFGSKSAFSLREEEYSPHCRAPRCVSGAGQLQTLSRCSTSAVQACRTRRRQVRISRSCRRYRASSGRSRPARRARAVRPRSTRCHS